MKLEQQVCSLKLAKKLKKLGIKQESLFYYSKIKDDFKIFCEWDIQPELPLERYSAFTVAELGEMLPVFLKIKDKNLYLKFKLYLSKENDEWFIEYQEWNLKRIDNYELLVQRNAETEADTRAKMLIYLIENNLLKLKN